MPQATVDPWEQQYALSPPDAAPSPVRASPPDAAPSPVRASLDLISQYESGNQNVPNYRFGPGYTAQGYYQITNTNWNKIAPLVGIDTSTHPNAMSAPKDVQAKVATYLLTQTPAGIRNWTDYNPRLRTAALAAAPAQQGYASRSADAADTAPAPVAPTAAAVGGTDLVGRIARGENVEVTPDDILRTAFGSTGETAPAPQPQAEASAPTVTRDPWEQQYTPAPPPPTPPASIADALKHEDFLHSAWNALISPFTATKSIVSGEYGQATHQQLQQAAQLEKSGTPEEKRAFARDVLLQNIPFASTIYKAFQGNLPGAAGDVAGFAAIPIAAKAVPAAAGAIKTGVGVATDVARSPGAADVLGVVSPRAANALRVFRRGANAIDALKEAFAEAKAKAAAPPTAAPAAPPTPDAEILPPSRQLGPGPVVTPPPADTSFVRAVPAQYPDVEPGFSRSPRVMPDAEAAQVFPAAYGQSSPAAAEPTPAAVPALEDPLQWTRAEINDRGGQLPTVSEIQRRFKMGYGAASDLLRAARGLPSTEPATTAAPVEAAAAAKPAPAATPPAAQPVADIMRAPTPGQAYAESQGYDWAKLSPEDRAGLEHVAQAQANVAAQPPPAATQSQTPGEFMRGAPATELEQQLADSIAKANAAKAAKQPAPETPPTQAAAPKPPNIYEKNARAVKVVRVADAAQEQGLTSIQVHKMDPADFARRVGEKSISTDTLMMVIDKLRRRESDAARAVPK